MAVDVGRRHDVRHITALTEQHNAVLEVQPLNVAFHLVEILLLGAALCASDLEQLPFGSMAKTAESVEQQRVTLSGLHSGDVGDQNGFRSCTQRGADSLSIGGGALKIKRTV